MKKMFVTIAIAISTLSAFAGDVNVNQKVLDAFKTEFATAKEVEWSVGSNYYKATFVYNDKYVFAYYNEIGDLLGNRSERIYWKVHPLLSLVESRLKVWLCTILPRGLNDMSRRSRVNT